MTTCSLCKMSDQKSGPYLGRLWSHADCKAERCPMRDGVVAGTNGTYEIPPHDFSVSMVDVSRWKPINMDTPRDRPILGRIAEGMRGRYYITVAVVKWTKRADNKGGSFWGDFEGKHFQPDEWCELPE